MKTNIYYISKSADKANEIYNTMTDKEKEYITGGDNRNWYIRQEDYSKNSVYSSLTVCNNLPISFLDVFSIDGIGEISIGVRKSKRHKGYAELEVIRLLEWYKENKNITKLSWCVNINNIKSVRLAEKFGFIRDQDRDFDEEWVAYKKE